jgi:pyrimidine operon attenuation protein / uracil phosphoribosyltransferase
MDNISTLSVATLIERISEELAAYLRERNRDNPAIIGLHTGGVWVAQALHQQLNIKEALGTLDISFYRDDFTHKGLHPEVKPSALPFEVEDRHIVLVRRCDYERAHHSRRIE